MKPSEFKSYKVYINSLHQRLRKINGKAQRCENEDCLKKSKGYEYALIYGRKYSADRKDYLALCRSCHRKYDWDNGIFPVQQKIFSESGKINGSKNGKIMMKLTLHQADEIRKKYLSSDTTQSVIAKEYGVDQAVISNIVNNKSYVQT